MQHKTLISAEGIDTFRRIMDWVMARAKYPVLAVNKITQREAAERHRMQYDYAVRGANGAPLELFEVTVETPDDFSLSNPPRNQTGVI